jgi:hypothetical protein
MSAETSHEAAVSEPAGVSRRRVLSGAGVALAGGVVAGAAATVAGAPLAGATGSGGVASGRSGTTAVELLCRITQDGSDFSGLGFLTSVAGLDPSSLFAGDGPRDQAHALYIVTATGSLVARSVDGAVHALDIAGRLEVYLRGRSGASLDDPSSSTSNRRLARYALTLQDVLTVVAPGTGLPVLSGTAEQTEAGSVNGRRFGAVGLELRFGATGLGTRHDTGTDVSNAQADLTVAGSLVVV